MFCELLNEEHISVLKRPGMFEAEPRTVYKDRRDDPLVTLGKHEALACTQRRDCMLEWHRPAYEPSETLIACGLQAGFCFVATRICNRGPGNGTCCLAVSVCHESVRFVTCDQTPVAAPVEKSVSTCILCFQRTICVAVLTCTCPHKCVQPQK
jgi:hypothetical protein